MTLRILGISGRIGAGKDTLAAHLAAMLPSLMPGYSPYRRGFADMIRDIMYTYFGIPHSTLHGSQADKAMPMPGLPDVTIRDAMKSIAGCLLSIDPEVMCSAAFRGIYSHWHSIHYVPMLAMIPDVRRPDEVRYIQSRGGRVIRLTHYDQQYYEPTGIDAALDGFDGFDATIDNGPFSPARTAATAASLLADWGWGK